MGRKRRQHWLVEVLRGPFAVSDNERNTAIPLAVVLHFLPGMLAIVPSLGIRNLWAFVLLITLLVTLAAILYPKQKPAVFSVTTGASALWLTGSVWIAQAVWVAVTGRLPHRVTPAEFVPRSTALTIAMLGFASWTLAAAMLLWQRRKGRTVACTGD